LELRDFDLLLNLKLREGLQEIFDFRQSEIRFWCHGTSLLILVPFGAVKILSKTSARLLKHANDVPGTAPIQMKPGSCDDAFFAAPPL